MGIILRWLYCLVLSIISLCVCRRGLLMGIWNAHTSVGNIVGTIVPSFWANPTHSDPNPAWGLSFIVPSLIMAVAAMLVFTLLVVGEPHQMSQKHELLL